MAHPGDDSTTNEDVQRVSSAVADRLAGLGIALTGRERPEELARLQEAVERFEVAVESRGGDLMVDEGPDGETTQPDDPHFALPKRGDEEPVDHYLERLALATYDVMQHEPKS